MLPSKLVLSLLYQFEDLALKSPIAVNRKGFFVLGAPTLFRNYQRKFQNRLEIDLGICKGLQSYKFYRQFVAQSTNIHVNNQYL